MSVVDGLIVNGGSEYKLSRRIRCPSSWVYALIRWSVNYTMDYKEWLPYRNKEGKVHVRIMCICRFYLINVIDTGRDVVTGGGGGGCNAL
jgi:hypothetical protein